jgi:hypothetical protein
MTTSPITSPLKILWAGNRAGSHPKKEKKIRAKREIFFTTSPMAFLPALWAGNRAGRAFIGLVIGLVELLQGW